MHGHIVMAIHDCLPNGLFIPNSKCVLEFDMVLVELLISTMKFEISTMLST